MGFNGLGSAVQTSPDEAKFWGTIQSLLFFREFRSIAPLAFYLKPAQVPVQTILGHYAVRLFSAVLEWNAIEFYRVEGWDERLDKYTKFIAFNLMYE